MIIFGIIGYEPITIKLFLKSVLRLLMNIGRGFIPSFLVFYAFVPIYNKLLGALTEKELKKIIMGLIFVITCCSTFFFANVFFEPLWYATLYFIAAYIRLYPNKFTDSLWLSLGALVFSVMLAIMSVLLISYVQTMEIPFISGLQIYEFVVDSHKPLALVVGLSAFLVAKNCKPFKSRFINWLSAGTFGVLLIHDQSDTMRHWLWEDFVQVSQLYKMHSSWYWSNHDSSGFIVVSLVVPVIIFFICSCIDALRRKYIEKPMFLYFQKRKTNQND